MYARNVRLCCLLVAVFAVAATVPAATLGTVTNSGATQPTGHPIGAATSPSLLENSGTIDDASITIAPQTLDVSTENASTPYGQTALLFDSNRDSYNVTMSAEGLSASTLQSVVRDAAVERRGDDSVTFQVPSSEYRVPLNLSALDRGEYRFEFTVPDSTAADAVRVVRFGPEDFAADFADDTVETAEGSIARIPILLRNTDRATVTVGSNESNYRSTVEVVDDDGDGVVLLEMNTWLAGRSADTEQRVFSATDGTVRNVTLRTAPVADPPLDPAVYDLGTSVAEFEQDFGILAIQNVSVAEPKTSTAPGDEYAALNSSDAIAAAEQRGALTTDSSVARDDVAVIRLRAPGLVGAIDAAQNGTTSATAAFLDILGDGDPIELRVDQRNPGANQERGRLDFRATADAGGLAVVPDSQSGSLFAVIHTERAVLQTATDGRRGLRPGDELRTNLTATTTDGGTRVAVSDWELVERTVTLDTSAPGSVAVRSAPCQEISGQTSVAPGTTLGLRLRGDDPAVLQTADPIVNRNGRFVTVQNFSDVPANASLRVSAADATVSETTVDVYDRPPAALRVENQSLVGRTVTVDAARLPFGGFVTLVDPTTFDVLGVSNRLPAGTTSSVPVALTTAPNETRPVLALAHADANGNGRFDGGNVDRLYRDDCSVVASTVTVSPRRSAEASSAPESTDRDD